MGNTYSNVELQSLADHIDTSDTLLRTFKTLLKSINLF